MANAGVGIGLVNALDLYSQIRGVEKISEEVVTRTISDMKSRAPAWVSKAVRQVYGISAGDMKGEVDLSISKKKAGSVKIKGATIADLALEYTGRHLTPTHFKMKPNTPTGGRRQLVSATIKKGKTKVLGSHVFVGEGKSFKGGGTGRALPFQRRGEARLPIKAVYVFPAHAGMIPPLS